MNGAIGLVEVIGLASAINISDIMLKVASVELIGLEKTKGMGWIVVKVAGGIGAVTASVEAGVAKAKENESLVAYKVIPRPGSGLESLMVGKDVLQKEKKKIDLIKKNEDTKTGKISGSEKAKSRESLVKPEAISIPASTNKEKEKTEKKDEKKEVKTSKSKKYPVKQ